MLHNNVKCTSLEKVVEARNPWTRFVNLDSAFYDSKGSRDHSGKRLSLDKKLATGFGYEGFFYV